MNYLYLRLSALSLILLGLCLLSTTASATHIRAAEITARRIDPQSLTYEITLRGYADTDSQVLFGSNGTLVFGDGTSLQLGNTGDPNSPTYIPRTRITEDTWLYEFKVRHTFPAARNFTISFREFYRNEGILNMDNSVNMPFYIETLIVIDPFLGVNSTPQLLVPPVDKAAVGKVYIHNPGAYDIDGDSLSYRLVIVRQDKNVPTANYRFPQNTFPAGDPRNGTSLGGGAATFTINPTTGDLVWDTPGAKGMYNVAFYVEEWRKIGGKYYLLGHVMRDMEIIVEDTDNKPPLVEIPEDICVVAGENILEKIGVTDPDGDPVDFYYFGAPFSIGAELKTEGVNLKNPDRLTSPAQLDFSWQTECSDVRRQPYQITLRARDVKAPASVALTNIKTWNIKVVAPQPAIERAVAIGDRSVEINFNSSAYACRQEASAVQVWRSVGSIDIPQDKCTTGTPAEYGYQLVDMRNLSNFPFTDNAKGAGLNPGATYCYRLVVVFPDPVGGESLISEERCVTLAAKMPLITQVSVQKTDADNGEIQLQWVQGPDLLEGEVAAPYSYDVYRAETTEGATFTRVATSLQNTQFTDNSANLNTKDKAYRYYVAFKDANGAKINQSPEASTVKLAAVPEQSQITLQWQATVPWSNQLQQHPHHIYRNQVDPNDPEKLVQIAQVNVSQGAFTYVDKGQDAGTGPLQADLALAYCYQVVSFGSYGNPKVADPLLNQSQIICSRTEVAPTGLDDPALSLVKIYPNPLKGQTFYFSLPEAEGKTIQLQLYDMKGQLVQQQANVRMQQEHAVELTEGKQGIYLLLIYHNGRVYRNKLIVQ